MNIKKIVKIKLNLKMAQVLSSSFDSLENENKIIKPLKYNTNYKHEDIIERVRKNEGYFEMVKYFINDYLGNGYTNAQLVSLARYFSNECSIYLDRMAKRNRNALLCWFSENWLSILPHLTSSNVMFLKKENDEHYNMNSSYPLVILDVHYLLNYH